MSILVYRGHGEAVRTHITGYEVKVGGVERVGLREVRRPYAEVTQLVYRSGSLLESLELVDGTVLLGGLHACSR